MRSKIGNVCMVLGTVLVLAALSLFIWNQWKDSQAGASSEKILAQLMGQMDASGIEKNKMTDPDFYDYTMKEMAIDGYSYIGYLTVPSLELELPVMSEWDYGRLDMAPCRYAGAIKSKDLVIAAHNYSRHFGKLADLLVGDKVYFTDVDGIRFSYTVAAMDVLTSYDVEEMTAGAYDMTLFTCDYGGENRVTVRCEMDRGKHAVV